MLTHTQTHHFRDYGYTTAPALFDANKVRSLRAGLECFKREGLGRNVATAEVVRGESLRKDV